MGQRMTIDAKKMAAELSRRIRQNRKPGEGFDEQRRSLLQTMAANIKWNREHPEEQDEREARGVGKKKHMGPGEHPSGSDQDVHAGDSTGGVNVDALQQLLDDWEHEDEHVNSIYKKAIDSINFGVLDTDEDKLLWKTNMQKALNAIYEKSPNAIRLADEAIKDFTFAPSPKQLANTIGLALVPPGSHSADLLPELIAGAYDSKRQELWLDGSTPSHEPWEVYVHELTHAVDHAVGKQNELSTEQSDSLSWFGVWDSSLSKGQLTAYGATSPTEGYAEFGRYIWTGNLDKAKNEFPEAYKYFQGHGLIK